MSGPQFSQAQYDFVNTGLSQDDAFKMVIRETMLLMNCHAVGTVTSFNSLNRTIQGTINYNKTFITQNADGTYQNTYKNYPTLVDVPVIVLSGGPASITLPIQAGDVFLIFFNDRDLDNWEFSGQVAAPNTSRLHSFSDGIALIGLLPFPQAALQSTYDLVNLNLRVSGLAKIKLSNATTTLNTLIGDLISAIKDITTLNSDSTTGVVSAASQLALTEIATEISELLA